MIKNHINIKKINQKYLYDIIRCHPNICSGRKEYSFYYKRILKNIFLSKVYTKNKTLNNKSLCKLNLID